MPRPKKKRLGRPPGSKNKKTKQKVAAAALTVAANGATNGNAHETLASLRSAVWTTVEDVYHEYITASEALEIFSEAQGLLNTLEAQGK